MKRLFIILPLVLCMALYGCKNTDNSIKISILESTTNTSQTTKTTCDTSNILESRVIMQRLSPSDYYFKDLDIFEDIFNDNSGMISFDDINNEMNIEITQYFNYTNDDEYEDIYNDTVIFTVDTDISKIIFRYDKNIKNKYSKYIPNGYIKSCNIPDERLLKIANILWKEATDENYTPQYTITEEINFYLTEYPQDTEKMNIETVDFNIDDYCNWGKKYDLSFLNEQLQEKFKYANYLAYEFTCPNHLLTGKSNKHKLIRSGFTSDLYNGYMYIGSDNVSYNSFIDEIKTIFTDSYIKETEIENEYYEYDGILYSPLGGRGSDIAFRSIDFKLVDKTENRIEFKGIAHYWHEDNIEATKHDKEYTFVILKTNTGWQFDKFPSWE